LAQSNGHDPPRLIDDAVPSFTAGLEAIVLGLEDAVGEIALPEVPPEVLPEVLVGVRLGGTLGRKAWLFAGSDRGGHRAALMYTLIVTAKMNGVDSQAWLADVLARIAEHPSQRFDERLPWNRKKAQVVGTQAA
jgi:hypothetical protein